jgi:hypothetical protein
MLKGWIRDLTLAVEAKSGASPALFVWVAVIIVALTTAFVFVCITTYDWLSQHYGSIAAGLMMAGIFALIAATVSFVCANARRRTMERAMFERTARAHAPSWWLDPRILAAGLQAGRAIGWQRIVPIALLGFIVAQWARGPREHSRHGTDG